MADTLTINGTAIDLAATATSIDLLVPFARGGCPELHFSRLVGKLAALPDPWSGKSVTLTMQATNAVEFSGDIVGYVDRWMDDAGWVREYRALGLLNRANYIPVTDSQVLTDTSVWNLPGDDPNFIPSRAGQTVGQIVTQILQMSENANALSAAGIGNYTGTTLPTITTNDLANLNIIPPWAVRISGERILQSLESFIQGIHPNFWLHVDPSGNIRVLDMRSGTNTTLTMGSDPRVGTPMLTRDYSDCYSQVHIRGNTLVRAVTIQTQPWPNSTLADGGLQEDFAWGSYTNAQAKANWTPADWSQPNQYGAPFDIGHCTCSDTTHVVVTSSNTSLTWAANALAQGAGEDLCTITLMADSLAGSLTQMFQARVIANTALAAGGTSTLTLDIAMPSTAYNAYQLFGLAQGANVVGRRYKVTNSAIAAQMMNWFPWPVAYTNALGNSAAMTSTPIGTVMWPAFGTSPPYNTGYDGVTLDPVNGLIYFDKPTQVVAGGLSTPVTWPANVQVFLPVAVGTLDAYAPSSSTYGGTLKTIEGISRTKTITVLEWKDYSNQSNMNSMAAEFLDALSNVVIEGTVPYYGLNTNYLAPGNAVNVAGNGYTTGWESIDCYVSSVEVQFHNGASPGTSYTTNLHLSNRRGRFSPENFLRPNITGQQFGGGEEPFGTPIAPPPTGPPPGGTNGLD